MPRAAIRPVRARGAPDRRERLLDGVLGAHPVAEAPEGEAEDGPGVAPVEQLEGIGVAPRDTADQVAVGQPALVPRVLAGRFPVAAMGHGSRQGNTETHLLGISTGFHVCWIAADGGLLHNHDPYRTLKNPLRGTNVSREEARDKHQGVPRCAGSFRSPWQGWHWCWPHPRQRRRARFRSRATGFVPATVTINQDDTVTWTNTDTKDHQVVANGGSFASPILQQARAIPRLPGGGTFRYHDGLHPNLRAPSRFGARRRWFRSQCPCLS